MEDKKTFKILLVEDNKLDVDLLRAMLMDVKEAAFEFEVVSRLSDALEIMRERRFDVALLDLSLPDSKGIGTFARFSSYASEIPILIVTSLDDESVALKAVSEGAQDYLVKGHITKDTFVRSIRYAIERHRLQEIIREQSVRDALTGLYNRRGFYALAEQQIRFAERHQILLSIFFMDLDRLKEVNDQFGHAAGDEALIETADILRESFRVSDIIARVGGDEFIVLTLANAEAPGDAIHHRLMDILHQHNAQSGRRFSLSFSVGSLSFAPPGIPSVDQLIGEADRAMYAQKRNKHNPRSNIYE